MKTKTSIPAPEAFWKGLRTRTFGWSILFLKEVGSTNDVALRLAGEGAPEGTVVVAESQTSGRGRRGRQWASVPGKSLLFSILLKPRLQPQELPKITLAAAVAVARTCEIFKVKARIKWPNDLLIGGRKLCGILTETGDKEDKMTRVVLGIGVNLDQTTRDFQMELRPIATSFFLASGHRVNRTAFLQALLHELERVYSWLEKKNFDKVLMEWRKRSLTIGSLVRVAQDSVVFMGEAVDIDGRGALLVKTDDGKIVPVLSGDVEGVATNMRKRSS